MRPTKTDMSRQRLQCCDKQPVTRSKDDLVMIKKKFVAITNQGNCEKLCHDTKILCRDTKQCSRKKLSHDKEFAIEIYYSSIQATRYSRIIVTQEKLCRDINQTTLEELCRDIANLCHDRIREEA